MHRVIRRIAIASIVWAAAGPIGGAAAQTSTATLSANVGTLAKLTLSSPSLSFPDADPETVPQIPASGGPLLITAKSRASDSVQVVLTVQATDDLRSGITVLPVSHITWTASGAGFIAGTMSKANAVTVASWNGSGTRSGSQQYYFANLWTHPTGVYSVTFTYTLTAP